MPTTTAPSASEDWTYFVRIRGGAPAPETLRGGPEALLALPASYTATAA